MLAKAVLGLAVVAAIGVMAGGAAVIFSGGEARVAARKVEFTGAHIACATGPAPPRFSRRRATTSGWWAG